MSGKKATVARLADLHSLVTESLIECCTATEIEVEVEEGKKKMVRQLPSAAVLGVALTHLKNNSITADPETNNRLSELRQKLQANRQGGKTSLAEMELAAEQYRGTVQ